MGAFLIWGFDASANYDVVYFKIWKTVVKIMGKLQTMENRSCEHFIYRYRLAVYRMAGRDKKVIKQFIRH